ncbi:MAG: ABC transporter substrate-binding protein [Planctomycetota bacterium]|nr:ABC transporter substrate-binding protein [Planctomycetota bacterium]
MAALRIASGLLLLSLPFLGVASCGGGEEPAPTGSVPKSAAEGEAGEAAPQVEIPMVQYQWDPMAGDESIPAAMGGPGFTGEGWDTNMEFLAIGSADAVKGGTMRRYTTDWPATLRQHGKDWNSSINYMVNDLCYESLLMPHPSTLEYIPRLATHWKISEDRSVYTFRINPAARWSDGSEVTANDVVASWKLRMDPKCLDPSSMGTYGKLDEPVAVSKYIVEVKCNQPNWRNFLYFSGMGIFPAAEVSIPGDEYLDKFQNAYTANSGPYIVPPEGIVMGASIELQRREDWWDIDNPAWTGMYNIDTYKYDIVLDPNLAFEKVKKGELDYYLVPRAQWWAQDIPTLDQVERGLLVMRKFYTDAPTGTSGIAINTQRAPLDDLRMRQVLQALYDRELFIDKLYYNEYEPLQSYYQGGTYQNQDNELFEYDPYLAEDLLIEMGYTEKDNEGYLVRDGQRLSFSLTYSSTFTQNLTIFQENCKDAGIEIELKYETPAARWKTMRQKKFDLTSTAWGALVFPNPETSFHGKYADQVDNNNVTSFSDPRVDELCTAYDEEYDVEVRREIIREIDGIIYGQMPYVLGWYNPAQRMLFWNKFSMPEWGGYRTADYDALHYVWWVDPAKEAALEAALKDPAAKMEAGSRENRFWKHWAKSQG